MEIEKDIFSRKWVVWKIDGSLKIELYNSKTKKDCVKFLNELKKGKK